MSDRNDSKDEEEKPVLHESPDKDSGGEKNKQNGLSPSPPQASTSSGLTHSTNGKHRHRGPSPGPSRGFGKLHSREKFIANEDYVKQIMDMGICKNGAIKALYWTGNQSTLAASNWIFDQPDRDLDTPLEDELEMIRAQQAEREREDLEEREFASHMCRMHHHHHLMNRHHPDTEDDIDEEDLMDDESDEDDEDIEDEEDLEDDDDDDMEFKMVFVINKSLDLKAGQMSLNVGRATAGLFRKINSQPQSVLVGPDELSMWGDLGERMVVLSGETEQHMKDLELMAKNIRLPCHMIDIVQVHNSLTNVDHFYSQTIFFRRAVPKKQFWEFSARRER